MSYRLYSGRPVRQRLQRVRAVRPLVHNLQRPGGHTMSQLHADLQVVPFVGLMHLGMSDNRHILGTSWRASNLQIMPRFMRYVQWRLLFLVFDLPDHRHACF